MWAASGVGAGLRPVAKPVPHELHLVGLRRVDAPRDVDHFLTVRTVLDEGRHVEGLLVMGDHFLHETDVVGRISRVRDPDRFLRVDRSRRLARSSGLKDRRVLRQSSACDHAAAEKERAQNQ
jgi:hypothetical protein